VSWDGREGRGLPDEADESGDGGVVVGGEDVLEGGQVGAGAQGLGR